MLKNTPERLTRWMLISEAPEPLSLNHSVQIDVAWAADEIAKLKNILIEANQRFDDYDMSVDCDVPTHHRDFMRRLNDLLPISE